MIARVLQGAVAFFDIDDSLPRLRASFAKADLKLDLRVVEAETWQDIRNSLHAPGWDDIGAIVIDSATRAEEWAVADTIVNVPHSDKEKKGTIVTRIEDYGYGKGYQHVYETFLMLLSDLDQHTRAGRHVILVCHDCTNIVPNPHGEDWIRWEPRLQHPASKTSTGKASIRLRVREWADHMLFVGYDMDVKDGKGIGSGTRTIWPSEFPHCMAKSRTLADPIPCEKFDTTLWTELLK